MSDFSVPGCLIIKSLTSVRLIRLLLIVFVIGLGLMASDVAPAEGRFSTFNIDPGASHSSGTPAIPNSTSVYSMFLPLVSAGTPLSQDLPIWSHLSAPAASEVSFFRYTFHSDKPLQNPQLYIFADTRYEVWMDGAWIGRGPARFSYTYRENDLYNLAPLPAGSHLIAVLVQWAPNVRRSESTTPFLQAHLQGIIDGSTQIVALTGSQWKAMLSDAWRQDAAPVHTWGLIGPTELVDLRRLPPDWMQPTYSDWNWPAAVTKDVSRQDYEAGFVPRLDPRVKSTNLQAPKVSSQIPKISSVTYESRSIPDLVNLPITTTVLDAGLLSPGRSIVEMMPSSTGPNSFGFNANPTVLAVEMLSSSDPQPSGVRLDGNALGWQAAGATRPDVYRALANLSAGAHTLLFPAIPSQGMTWSLSNQNISTPNLPFQQGVNVGRRLLLAEPVSQPGQVLVSTAPNLSVSFAALPAYVVLDLGRTVHGRLQADVVGSPGGVVDIGWDERLLTGTLRPLPYPGSLHPQWNQTDSWILDGTTRSISTLDTRAGRYILICVWGTGTGIVQVKNIRVYEEGYPVNARGGFHSSDPLLDTIWQVGVNTTRLNMTDAYTDTPWRERGQWWGDAYVEDHNNRVAFGDNRLLKRGLLLMADAFSRGSAPAMAPNNNGLVMLDYSMLWVNSLQEYSQRTADTQLLMRVYPVLRAFMSFLAGYENASTGLLDLPPAPWQTAYIDAIGDSSRYGQSTAVNSMYYSTLLNAASIAESVGNAAEALVWRRKAVDVKQRVNTYLFLPSQHRYLASISQGILVAPSTHAQAWALAYDLVPEQEIQPVASSLLALLSSGPSSPNVEMYGMFWVLEALGHAGRVPEGMSLIRNYYGRMLGLGAATWWESFNSNLYYTASLSHGWGSSPTWFLTTFVLGARQTGPNTWAIKPAYGTAKFIAGTLPLEKGNLDVQWTSPSCQDMSLNLSAPTGTGGEIIIPLFSPTTVLTLDNAVIWQNGGPLAGGVTNLSDGIHVALGAGAHSLQAHQTCYSNYLPALVK